MKRTRSARAQRENSENARDKLDGFVPVAQDWDAGICLLEVRRFTCPIHKSLYTNHDYCIIGYVEETV